MKNLIKNLSLLFLFLTIFSLISFAQTDEAETDKKVKPVEEYADAINKFVEKEGKPHLVIADISDYKESEKPLWKKFASEAVFEKSRETGEVYKVAYIWQKAGKPVAVNITYSSPSGDWAQFVVYYFRADGSIAKIDSRLNTFYGNVSALRTFLYDAKGNLLEKTSEFLDLESQKPFDPKDRNFSDREVKIYKSVKNLPFANLLKNPVKKK